MAKELIINQTLSEQRVGLIENGEILDLLIDRPGDERDDRPFVGNIYKGKVIRVLPGMQSAFIDIGLEKAAFLYVDDAYIPSIEEQREMIKNRTKEERPEVGNVIPDEMSTFTESVLKLRKDISIDSILKEGKEVIVQVAKEPLGTKGPRVTRHITLAGRHVVFMPFIEHTGVSRRIQEEAERARLKEILDSIRPEGKGIIARTVAEGQSYKLLKSDFNMLVKIWKEVLRKAGKVKAPGLIYQDLTFIQRVLRDITDEDVDTIVVDTKHTYNQVEKFTSKFLPTMKGKIKLYNDDTPIFEYYGIELEIERGISNKIYLKSGGSINVDQTEALVSIDVNTGKFVGKKTPEETILKTNLEAVKEIAYQLRLRNCGGIIIIDFIDMEKEEHRNSVYQALLEALKKDRSKTNVLPISALGLIEMTRKRTRETLPRILCNSCPYCEGTGRVKSPTTVCYDLIRELIKVVKKAKGQKIYVYAHPEVSAQLSGKELDIIETLEEQYSKTFIIRAENNYHIEQYDIYAQEF
ncbi:MAG: Rne/Rng family ribonuclease [Oligoflexia bacterium]|nr:Rne/Rng family ribonuclease [Oligoflexia bacterium]MBF0366023.1 Rne/Rng family ribonuclease [Oligoflexia bacterium]